MQIGMVSRHVEQRYIVEGCAFDLLDIMNAEFCGGSTSARLISAKLGLMHTSYLFNKYYLTSSTTDTMVHICTSSSFWNEIAGDYRRGGFFN